MKRMENLIITYLKDIDQSTFTGEGDYYGFNYIYSGDVFTYYGYGYGFDNDSGSGYKNSSGYGDGNDFSSIEGSGFGYGFVLGSGRGFRDCSGSGVDGDLGFDDYD